MPAESANSNKKYGICTFQRPEALTEEMMKKYLDRLRFDLISDEDSEKRESNRKRRIFKREA